MIPGVAPIGAIPIGGLWAGAAVAAATVVRPVQALAAEAGVWLAEIATRQVVLGSGPAPVGLLLPGMAALATPDRPEDLAADVPVVLVSDRGWIGEPGDSVAPNTPYPPRMAEPPALERNLPLYPDTSRRLAVTAGELRLANGDGVLDVLAGDWSVAGRRVVLRRGPHRRPLHADQAEFTRVAELRAAGAASGIARLGIPLRSAAADLDGPACRTYAGTGDAEGGSNLTGQPKPLLYGFRRNLDPVPVSAGLLLYQVHDGALYQVVAVRDRGVALTFAGDFGSYAALAAATVSSGTYVTCLALGLLRVGATPSSLTVDARGDAEALTGGYNAGTAASIARKLLAGPGGLPTADATLFDWPGGEAGLLVRGGSVAAALDALAAGVFGWWGSDAFGHFGGGTLAAPEELGAALSIEPWMLAAPPEEIGPLRAPWWRARVGYQALERVQAEEQLAGAVSAADREYYGQAWRLAVSADTALSVSYPLAEDGPELASAFEAEGDAQALAERMLALFGRPRRVFLARMRAGAGGYAWPTAELGACFNLRWPQHRALAAGRPMIVQGVSARGDATTLTLWG